MITWDIYFIITIINFTSFDIVFNWNVRLKNTLSTPWRFKFTTKIIFVVLEIILTDFNERFLKVFISGDVIFYILISFEATENNWFPHLSTIS